MAPKMSPSTSRVRPPDYRPVQPFRAPFRAIATSVNSPKAGLRYLTMRLSWPFDASSSLYVAASCVRRPRHLVLVAVLIDLHRAVPQVAMASVWGNGTLDECEPVAIVKDTQLQYSILPDGNIHTLFLGFNVYTDWRGNQFSAFFQIDCFKGGPTSKFTYTSIGDEGHQSIFQINTQADCTATAAPTPHTTPHPTAVPTRHPVATHHPTHSPTCPPPGPTQCSCPSPSPSAPITRGSAHDVSTVTLSAGALAAIVLAVAIGCFVLGIVCHAPVRRLFDSTGPQRGTQNSGQLVSNQSAMYE
eukprot:m.15403 g.15403  ORF g.15403 m.15403 type:complete len:301 (-) comp4906_c0_seq2:204-1106(-)